MHLKKKCPHNSFENSIYRQKKFCLKDQFHLLLKKENKMN